MYMEESLKDLPSSHPDNNSWMHHFMPIGLILRFRVQSQLTCRHCSRTKDAHEFFSMPDNLQTYDYEESMDKPGVTNLDKSTQIKCILHWISLSTSKKRSLIKKATSGKLTKKNLGLHKLLFANGDLLKEVNEQPVKYLVVEETELQCKICDSGTYCFCCKKLVSPSQFEAHAGHGQRRKPMLEVVKGSEREMVPGADPVEQILQRCIRIVKIPKVDIGGCVISRPEAEWFCCDNCGMIYVLYKN